MQSRRPLLAEIGTSQTVDAVLKRVPASAIALAEPGGDPISLETPVVLVGPEGGWSERELAVITNRVALGDGVLRVETAALAAGAILTALRSMALDLRVAGFRGSATGSATELPCRMMPSRATLRGWVLVR